MSNIDNLRLKGANAKTANVGVTGNDLLTIINYANEQGQIGTGDIKSDGSVPFTGQEDFQSGLKVDTITPSGTSLVSFAAMLGLKVYTTAQEALLVPTAGAVYYNSDLDAIRSYDGAAWNTVGGLSTTGSDAGATASPQVFEQGVELGIDNGVNGELTIYNGDSTGSILISSSIDKDLTIDNASNDVDLTLKGKALFSDYVGVANAFIVYDQFNDINRILVDNVAQAVTIIASGGLLVNMGAVKADTYLGYTADGNLTVGQGSENIFIDGSHNVIDISATMLKINATDTYTGNFDPATVTNIIVVNGLITSVS